MTPLEQLIRDFPVYQNVRCGVDVGDGWVPILRALAPIIAEHGATVEQIKEKFGSLRCYAEGHDVSGYDHWCDHPLEQAIRRAEFVAAHTCEFCGSTDDVKRAGRWIKTVCGACRAEKLDAEGRWRR